ncbi:MAG: tetratricopeptide repeat protein [Myxococcota bacterium]
MRRILAALSLMLVPSIASADARQDIIDLRRGQLESQSTFLGWTDDGRAVSRRLVCSEGGAVVCRASIDALEVGADEESTVLFHSDNFEGDYEDPRKGPVSTAEAMAFIRGETKALDDLGALEAGTKSSDPKGVFGVVGGTQTKVYLRTSRHRTDEEALNLFISVRGPRGASIDLEHMVNAPWRVDSEQVIDARISPDGESVWLAMHYTDGVMCWDGEDIELTIADRGRVRAQLANAAGMRAYRSGDFDEAAELFGEATAEDPSYGWSWFNQGAMHSRNGDFEEADQSLRNAMNTDHRFAERACADDDYHALMVEDPAYAAMCNEQEEGYDAGC